MERIIGGEFAITLSSVSTEGPRKTGLYSSGRAALFAILRKVHESRGINSILVPDYLCSSVTRTIEDSGLSYSFYHINNSLHPNLDSLIQQVRTDSSVLLINYFGVVNQIEEIDKIKKKFPECIVILDDVQSYYNLGRDVADFSFTSYRKWFPLPDGAEAYGLGIENQWIEENRFSQYKLAGNIIKNLYRDIDDSIALGLISQGEEILDREGYKCKCSDYTARTIMTLDFTNIAKIRRTNADFIHTALLRIGVYHIYDENSVPLFVPVFLKDRNRIRNALFKNNIFAPIHWPIESSKLNGNNRLYEEELSLICDQRYSIEDMEYMMEIFCDAYRNNG